jgi:hypothetical protein
MIAKPTSIILGGKAKKIARATFTRILILPSNQATFIY